jgi:hypothetical protein
MCKCWHHSPMVHDLTFVIDQDATLIYWSTDFILYMWYGYENKFYTLHV